MKTTPLPLIFFIAIFSPSSFAALSEKEIQDILSEKKYLSESQKSKLKSALSNKMITTGTAPATVHPATTQECKEKSLPQLVSQEKDSNFCGAPWMARIPNTSSCIDRFEYPNIACSFPITWVQANEAAQICAIEGKHLCDASEWEGACTGQPQEDDWVRGSNNSGRNILWAYGAERKTNICAFGQAKSPGCDQAISNNKNIYQSCGTNSWPSGFFPHCKSSIEVYDQHGNVAEHMNLARNPQESGKNNGSGVTEMKGSWFVFPDSKQDKIHKDDCTWREPGWHRTLVKNPKSHANYHLGFRCCKNTSISE